MVHTHLLIYYKITHSHCSSSSCQFMREYSPVHTSVHFFQQSHHQWCFLKSFGVSVLWHQMSCSGDPANGDRSLTCAPAALAHDSDLLIQMCFFVCWLACVFLLLYHTNADFRTTETRMCFEYRWTPCSFFSVRVRPLHSSLLSAATCALRHRSPAETQNLLWVPHLLHPPGSECRLPQADQWEDPPAHCPLRAGRLLERWVRWPEQGLPHMEVWWGPVSSSLTQYEGVSSSWGF